MSGRRMLCMMPAPVKREPRVRPQRSMNCLVPETADIASPAQENTVNHCRPSWRCLSVSIQSAHVHAAAHGGPRASRGRLAGANIARSTGSDAVTTTSAFAFAAAKATSSLASTAKAAATTAATITSSTSSTSYTCSTTSSTSHSSRDNHCGPAFRFSALGYPCCERHSPRPPWSAWALCSTLGNWLSYTRRNVLQAIA
jgi:hypothetical protein